MSSLTHAADGRSPSPSRSHAAMRAGIVRALGWSRPPELWLALALALAAATAPAPSRAETIEPAVGELDTVATVTEGSTRYELTNFTCAREAQLQAQGATSQRARAYGQWLARQPAGLKSMAVRAGSAYDGGGCYERIPGGIRVYIQRYARPRDVIAPIVAGDAPAAVQN